MRTIDADALIEFCAERWIPLNIDAVNMQPTIQPEERTEKRTETHGVCLDAISRQAALDIFDDYNVSVENGELEAYSRDRKRMCELPPAQPEPTDTNAKEAVYNLAEKIGIHQLFALTVELRGEPIQPEPAIPLSWIEKYIEWLKSFDNEFANLEVAHISVMVKKWRGEQNERPN